MVFFCARLLTRPFAQAEQKEEPLRCDRSAWSPIPWKTDREHMIGPTAPQAAQKGPSTWECPRTGDNERWRERKVAPDKRGRPPHFSPAGTESRIPRGVCCKGTGREGRCYAEKTQEAARGGKREKEGEIEKQGTATLSNCGCCFRAFAVSPGQYDSSSAHSVHGWARVSPPLSLRFKNSRGKARVKKGKIKLGNVAWQHRTCLLLGAHSSRKEGDSGEKKVGEWACPRTFLH